MTAKSRPPSAVRRPSRRLAAAALLGCALGGGGALAALAGGAPAAAPASGSGTGDGDRYTREIAAWRDERGAGLKSPNGWLTLVGLFWLEEGENRFGSDPANRIVLPAGKSPAVAGALLRHGREVSLRPEPGAGLTVDGRPAAAMPLASDAKGAPTVLHLGPLSFFVIARGDRLGVRVKDSESAALAAFHGLDDFPVAPAWRVAARFEPYQPPKKIAIANVLGQIEDQPSPGAVVFERDGRTFRLDALGDDADGHRLFLIFADQTNGRETYGAGRFLTTEPLHGGRVIVDFNKAYNPPCAFSPFATCPLPPPQNRLALRVEAGEKKYGVGHS